MTRPTVRLRDLGYLAIIRQLKELGQSYVAVGVFGGRSTDKTPLTLVAAANEFGVPGRIPARSFLRSSMDESQDEFRKLRLKVLDKVSAGKMTNREGLTLLGLWAQKKVQQKISSNIPPPNAPSTVRKKMAKVTLDYGKKGEGKKAKPKDTSFRGVRTLIDTGQLRLGITYEVGDGKHPIPPGRKAGGR